MHRRGGGGRSARLLLFLTAGLGACATSGNPADPWEDMNRFFFGFNEVLDSMVGQPLAELYNAILPEFAREGLHNAFDNLGYLNVIVNDLLQGNVDEGLEGCARMLVNSTLGIAGIFDVATDMGLPRREQDFGLTLRAWGVDQGPYLVLPVIGPTTTRDIWSHPVAAGTNPLFWVDFGKAVLVVGGFKVVDSRARADTQLKQRDELAIDRYVFTREGFLARRRALASEDEPPDEIDDELYEDFDDGEMEE